MNNVTHVLFKFHLKYSFKDLRNQLLRIFSTEQNEWIYKLLQNNKCSDFTKTCKFEINSEYPTSPFISYYFTDLIDGTRYFEINIEFPPEQRQRYFYLETYDASNHKSLVLGGKLDIFNCTEIEECSYYIKLIGGTENSESFQLNFLELPNNFTMSVEVLFPSGIYYSILFSEWQDAIYISEDLWLTNYFNERQNQIESFKDRKKK